MPIVIDNLAAYTTGSAERMRYIVRRSQQGTMS
jgi:hypothetical protein